MADTQIEFGGTEKNQGSRYLWIALAAGCVAWLYLIWLGTGATLSRVSHDELVIVAAWGVAIVFGGLFVVYTGTIVAGIHARQRLRSTLRRSMRLADEVLEEARSQDATHSA